MPTNLVHTPSQEKDWRQAKAIAEKNGHKENWPYIVSIYKSKQGKEKVAMLLKQAYAIHPSTASKILLNGMEKKAVFGMYELPALRWYDKIIRLAPTWLKPSMQKMIVRIKYPELYGVLEQKLQRSKYHGGMRKSLIEALLGENKAMSRGLARSETSNIWNQIAGPNTPRGPYRNNDADLLSLLGLGGAR